MKIISRFTSLKLSKSRGNEFEKSKGTLMQTNGDIKFY